MEGMATKVFIEGKTTIHGVAINSEKEKEIASNAEAEQIVKKEKIKKNNSYVRADMINLADLDVALDRLHKGKIPVCRRKEEWEIDLNKLVLKNLIARGTYGIVYKGSYEGQVVAVKLLDWGEESTMLKFEIEASRAAFRQEVIVWHKLDHPNVTKFIGASMGNGDLEIPSDKRGGGGFVHVASNVCCVVVEYLAGGTLKAFLIQHHNRKLTFSVAMQIALDLSRGLSYLHSQSIIHRDVKSENMLLDKKMNLKIADFGVARVEAQNPKDMTGETGTLSYMAPENLRPEIPKCCPSSLATVMKKCWDANPDKRPTMGEVVQMLEAIDTSKGGDMIPTKHSKHSKGCFCF